MATVMTKTKTPRQRPYDSKKWQGLREFVVERDGGRCQLRIAKRCQPAGLSASSSAPARFKVHVHHLEAWAEGGSYFDPQNLVAACNPCNAKESAQRKRQSGWRHCDTEIVLVLGPPGGAWAGDAAAAEAGRHDLIIDYTAIARALAGEDAPLSQQTHDAARAQYGRLLTEVRKGETGADRVFIVSSNPEALELFPHHRHVVIDVDLATAAAVASNQTDEGRERLEAWFASSIAGGQRW